MNIRKAYGGNAKTDMRDRLKQWFHGTDYSVISEFENGLALFWVVEVCGERTNNLPEYYLMRAIMLGDKVDVSGDTTNGTALEILRKLSHVIQP